MAETESIHVRGEGGVVWEMGLPLPDGVAQRLDNGDLTRVNEDGSQFELDEDDGPPVPPSRAASQAAWVEWAVSQGADRDEVKDLKRDELVELYG